MNTNIDLFFELYIKHIIEEFNLNEQSKKNKWLVPKDKAFEIFSISTVLWKSFSEVYNEINTWWYRDEKFSSEDGWFDWIYLEETWDDSYIVHIFQCKNKSTLSPKDLNDFYYDVDLVFKKWQENSKPLNKKTKQIIKNFKSLKWKYIDYRLYFIYNWENNFWNNQNLVDEYKNKFLIFDKNHIYKEIWNNILEWKRKELDFVFNIERSNINFWEDLQSIISFWITGVQSYVFKINALEICRMIEEEEKKNNGIENLYSKNIRWFLGYRTKPNKKMKETIKDSKQSWKFYLYNNWLTIICDSLKEPSLNNWNYTFSIKNPIIVNWLQTSQVIYKEYKENKNNLKNIFLLIRLYQTTDDDIIEKITETTNNQSAINYWDQLSNKDFNTFAKEIFKNISVNYITKRWDIFKQENIKSNHKDINNDTLLKFWFATFLQKPTIAKNSIRKVTWDVLNNINDDSDNKNIKKIFEWWKNAKILEHLLSTYYIYSFVIEKKNLTSTKEKLSDFILNSDELMAYWIYKELNKDNLEIKLENIEKVYKKVYENIFEIVKEESKAKENANLTYSHNNYFKWMKCKIDYDKKAWFIDMEESEIIDALLN